MRCSNNDDARFMWERWPNFNFITMPGNLFFPVHPFTPSSSLNTVKILQFSCKEPGTKQLRKDQLFSSYP